jgi:lipoprotein-anchoring transpeptidase ErfK/SrfK
MSKRVVVITLSILLGVVVVAGVGLFAYDASKSDAIAKGVEVGGVHVGGMTEKQARAKLRAAYLEPLEQPISVKAGSRTFHLTAKQTEVAANIDAMVQEAVSRSRTGNPWERGIRELTGGTVDANLTPEVTYSKESVDRLVARIRERVNRAAVDAKVEIGLDGPSEVKGHDGTQLQVTRLTRKLRKAVVSPTADRTLKAGMWTKKPAVSNAKVAQEYSTALVVDRAAFQLKLFKDMKLVKTYDVAIGAQGRDTPAGLYHIQNKAVDPDWNVPYSDWTGDLAGTVVPGGSPENPLKARWLGIIDGAGIHGIDPSEYGSIGQAASHGCVRMRIPDVIDLYPRVPVGAPIYIA